MSVTIVYAQQDLPDDAIVERSIFLAGPTPRSIDVKSWRHDFVQELLKLDLDCTVFLPEPRSQEWPGDYLHQVQWEKKNLDRADVIAFWVPRELKDMPAFTTNVEFGKYAYSGRAIYGRPQNAPKNSYLDWMYRDATGNLPHNSMDSMARAIADLLYEGGERTGGECSVPLSIWKTEMFQKWYQAQKAVGNRLEDAKVLWNFSIPKRNVLFSYILWVDMWIAAENRHKKNEFIFSRKDISCIVPIWLQPWEPWPYNLLDGKVVLVKEYRSPARSSDCYVHELPGGSSFKDGEEVLTVASHELEEETGLKIPAERFKSLGSRQVASTLSTHASNLFYCFITDDELKQAEEMEQKQSVHGVVEDTERTYIEVRRVKDLLDNNKDVDWAMMGMLFQALFTDGRKDFEPE